MLSTSDALRFGHVSVEAECSADNLLRRASKLVEPADGLGPELTLNGAYVGCWGVVAGTARLRARACGACQKLKTPLVPSDLPHSVLDATSCGYQLT